MVQLTNAVTRTLLQAVLGRQSFVFSLHDGEGYGLGSRGERATENVIGAASRALAGLVIDDVNGLGGFLNANVGAAVPAPVFESGVDQLKSGLGFVARHQSGGCLAGAGKRGNAAASKHATATADPTWPDVVARYWLSSGPSEY